MDSGIRRKRQRGFTKKKLRINERVEVRSVEDGFLGSWHLGTVIDCGKLKRHVRYENILDDDGINNLEFVMSVSYALDGKSCFLDCYKRGLIRPLPPLIEFDRRSLEFGLCVDVSYHGVWWEGVIFDHNDGMEERSVFFPDLDDEMDIGIHQLRITQDWDEVTEKWEQRGKWVFLELIEECERTSCVAVSAKHIWHGLRGRGDFIRIGEWTFNVKDLWRDMVLDVVDEYCSIILQKVLSEFQHDESIMDHTFDSHLSHVPLYPSEKIQDPDTSPAILPPPPVEVVDEPEFADEPEFCPQAVVEYYSHAFKKNWADKRKCIQKAKKHLLAGGWTLQHHPTNKRRGIKYISPQKKNFQTLHAACRFYITDSGMQPLNDSVINEENVDQVQNGDLLHRVSQLLPEKPALHGIDGVAASGSAAKRKRKCLRSSKGCTYTHEL